MSEDIRVNRSVTIPASELELKFSPSGGPGGQHANKSSTRVEVVWNFASSQALGPRQRQRVLRRLARRIDSQGRVRLSSDTYRSQTRNRDDVLERLRALVADALKIERRRIPTTATARSQERRLEAKRRRAAVKRLRQVPADE